MRRLARMALLLFGTIASCAGDPNTQYLPIGSRCGSNGDCGTTPYTCVTAGYRGGYCQKDCTTDGDCPTDSVCALRECRRKCKASSDCRAAEGYACRDVQATFTVCEVGELPDGGSPD